MAQKWDVVIIGAGLAGLVAANVLIKSNLSVLVLEKGKKAGGRARTDRIRQQYFNLGPHALYKKSKAKAILEELSIQLSGKSPKIESILTDGDLAYTAPFSLSGLLSTNLLNWKERIEWANVLVKVLTLNPEKLKQLTYGQWVQQTTHSATIQSLLHILGRLATYCYPAEKASGKIILSHLQAVMGGVLYLDKGWQTIIDQLHNKAVISGVQVQTRKSVKQIVPLEHEHFQLVLSDDEVIAGKHVIATVGPHALHHMLAEASPFAEVVSNLVAIKGATLDVALTRLPNPRKLFALGITDPLYFSVHSNYAKLSDDPQHVVLHVFKYHHPDDTIDGEKVKNELEQFSEKMQPGWKNDEITSRFIPQITVNHRLPQIGEVQILYNSTRRLPGLYVAGDWASPDSILSEGAITSGKQAAEDIIKKEKSGSRAN